MNYLDYYRKCSVQQFLWYQILLKVLRGDLTKNLLNFSITQWIQFQN